ncbi:MAG: serine hydrolase [Solibacillus sp.]
MTLNEVAKGMIAFSSNANTDFLLTKLGIDAVNNRLKALNLLDHTPIYPLVSALYVPLYLHEEKQVPIKNIASVIEKMSMQEYVQYVLQIHNRLLEMPFSTEEKVKATKLLKLDVQKALSDKQSSSTTRMYSELMSTLNRKNVLPSEVHQYLDPVMEQTMNQASYREQFKHFGRKGGSTAFVLTDAVYAADLDGNMFELAFFANDLTMLEQTKLSTNLRRSYEEYLKRLINMQPVK